MRAMSLAPVSLVMIALMVSDADAASNRWCAVTPKRSENCGYATLDQCRAYMLGLEAGADPPLTPPGVAEGVSEGAPEVPGTCE